MKKLSALLLAFGLVVGMASFTSCGKESGETDGTDSTATEDTVAAEPEPSEMPSTPTSNEAQETTGSNETVVDEAVEVVEDAVEEVEDVVEETTTRIQSEQQKTDTRLKSAEETAGKTGSRLKGK